MAQQDSSSFTPGPWHDTGLPVEYPAAICNDRGIFIADVKRGPLMDGPNPAGHGEANARLIAAAPDLLTALLDAMADLIGAYGALEKRGGDPGIAPQQRLIEYQQLVTRATSTEAQS